MYLHNNFAYFLLGSADIAWQKKTNFKYCKNPEHYRRFYKILVRVTCCSSIPLSVVMQRKLVLWLRSRGERKAADWLEKYWTGDRGNWTRGHGGVGGTNNNNGTEGRWNGLKKFMCGSSGSTAGIRCINSA